MFATASYGGGWSPLKCPQPPQVRPSCRSRRPDSSLNNTHHYVYAGGCGYRSIAQIGSSHTALFCSSTTCPPVRPAARMSEAESENCSHCASARDNTHDTHTHTHSVRHGRSSVPVSLDLALQSHDPHHQPAADDEKHRNHLTPGPAAICVPSSSSSSSLHDDK